PTEFVHPIQEGGDPLALDASCSRAEHPYRWQPCRLLRPRRERPCTRRAAEQRDERAASHSITSSARASSVGGTSRPIALGVGKLMTNWNLVDCTTGRSTGLAPLRMRPV